MKKSNLFAQIAIFVSVVHVGNNLLYGDTISHLKQDITNEEGCEKTRITCEDGRIYEGCSKFGIPHGEGKVIFKNIVSDGGDYIKGKWVNGELGDSFSVYKNNKLIAIYKDGKPIENTNGKDE